MTRASPTRLKSMVFEVGIFQVYPRVTALLLVPVLQVILFELLKLAIAIKSLASSLINTYLLGHLEKLASFIERG